MSRNIPSEWSLMKRPYPRREYHTWKTSRIKNDTMKCDDQRFFASNIWTTPQEQNTSYGSSRFNHLAYSGSSRNQGSRKFSSYLSSVPRRVFSSKSCPTIQQSIRKIESLREDLNANASIVRLRSTRSHPGVLKS